MSQFGREGGVREIGASNHIYCIKLEATGNVIIVRYEIMDVDQGFILNQGNQSELRRILWI